MSSAQCYVEVPDILSRKRHLPYKECEHTHLAINAAPVNDKSHSMTNMPTPHGRLRYFRVTILIGLSVGLMTAGFYANTWKAAPDYQFSDFTAGSESLIIGRLVKSRTDGYFSDGAFPGRGDYSVRAPYEVRTRHQYQTYFDSGTFHTFYPYKSQLAFQSWLFSNLDSIFNVSNYQKLEIFRFLTALMTAIVLSGFVAWIFEEFGLFTASTVFFCIVSSIWITLFARNIWWMTGVFYLPVISILFLLRQCETQHHYSHLNAIALAYVSLFTKCLFTGFEYITTTLIMMVSPLMYYTAKCQWTRQDCLHRIGVISLACTAAVLSYLGILLHQLSKTEGGYDRAVHYIYSRIVKRTYYFDTSEFFHPGHASSLWNVLNDYAHSTLMSIEWAAEDLLPFSSSFSLQAWQLVTILAVVTLAAHSILKKQGSDEERQIKCFALLATAWFSLLAPLSWLIIFKSHSAEHLHMNHIIWHMPFALFSFGAIGFFITMIFPSIRYGRNYR